MKPIENVLPVLYYILKGLFGNFPVK